MKQILMTLLILFGIIPTVIAEEFESYSGIVVMHGEILNDELVRISVDVEDLMVPVIGGAFHLIFEDEKLDFLKYEPGDFFEMGGDPFYLVKQTGKGEVVFGSTLTKSSDLPIGNGKIADFYFQKNQDGEYRFDFNRGILSTFDTVRQDLDKIDWQGTTINGEEKEIVLSGEKTTVEKGDITSIIEAIKNKSNFWVYFSWSILGAYLVMKFFKNKFLPYS